MTDRLLPVEHRVQMRHGVRGAARRPRRGMEAIMRNRHFVGIMLLVGSLGQIGCIMPIYSSSPDVRARQLIFVSEGYRHIPEIWERVWGLDMPDVATPYRTHGGVI